MRLGADPVKLHEGTRAREIFGEAVIYKRHRHRYEVNNQLRRRLEDEGLVAAGTSPDERLVEVIELPDHPFFVASQFHPEFNSRPTRPEPLFREFVGAAAERAAERGDDPAPRMPTSRRRAAPRSSARDLHLLGRHRRRLRRHPPAAPQGAADPRDGARVAAGLLADDRPRARRDRRRRSTTSSTGVQIAEEIDFTRGDGASVRERDGRHRDRHDLLPLALDPQRVVRGAALLARDASRSGATATATSTRRSSSTTTTWTTPARCGSTRISSIR